MSLWESTFILAAISSLGLVCFYGLRPWLERAGLQTYPAYLLSISVAFIVMLAWAVGAFLLEGDPRTLAAFYTPRTSAYVQSQAAAVVLGFELVHVPGDDPFLAPDRLPS